MSWQSWGSVILSLSIPVVVWAQGPARIGQTPNRTNEDPSAEGGARDGDVKSPSADRSDRRDRHIRNAGYGEHRGQQIDTSVLDPKRLADELKLEWQQKQDVEQIFREYNAAVADLRRDRQGGQAEQEKKRLYDELKMARQSRDTNRAKEIMAQLKQLRSSVSDDEQEYQEMLIEEIEKVLNEGQRTQFRRMLRPDPRERGRTIGPLEDPEALFQCVEQVKLQDYQKSQIEQIKRSYQDEVKRMGPNARPEEKKMLGERILREVDLVLNEEQKKELRRVHARMSGDNPTGPIDVTDFRQLSYAVMRLNATEHRLSQDQQTELRRLQGDYLRQIREVPRDDEMARKRLGEQLSQQVMMVLTPEQQEAVKNTPAPTGRFSGSSDDRSSRRFYRGGRGPRSDDSNGEPRSMRGGRSRFRGDDNGGADRTD